MRRKMEKQIGLRLDEPAYLFIERKADADERSPTETARRLLYERIAELVEHPTSANRSPASSSGNTITAT